MESTQTPERSPAGERPPDYEKIIGAGMQIVGSLLVFLGVAFFLKLAFNQWGGSPWFGPQARVLGGLAAGVVLIAVGSRRAQGAMALVNEGLVALGGGLLYLALWAAAAMFHLVPPAAVLAAMLAVTALIVTLAWKRSSERLAIGALVGGYLSPALLGFGAVDRVELAAYLLVIGAGLLWLSNVARFRLTEVLAFVALLCYTPFFAVDANALSPWTAMQSALVATLFFIEYAGALYLQARKTDTFSPAKLGLIGLQTGLYIIALGIDFADQRHTLGLALLALGAVLLAAVRSRSIPRAVRTAYGWLGLGSVTLAVPAYFADTNIVLDAISIEGAMLVYLGMRSQYRLLRAVGYGLLACSGTFLAATTGLDVAAGVAPAHPFLNSHFTSLALFALALGSVAYGLRDYRETVSDAEALILRVCGLIANATLLTAIELDTANAFAGNAWAQAMVSLVAAGYATIAILAGIARRDNELKAFAIVILSTIVLKIFAVDLAFLGSLHRTITFVSIGIMLVGASIVYQRALAQRPVEE